jgi:putative glutamine amidotransferase
MKIINSIVIIGLLFLISSCESANTNTYTDTLSNKKQNLHIGISKAKGSKGYLQYGLWLSKLDSNVIYYDLYHINIDSALTILSSCDGLLISGGPDVTPSRYGEILDTNRCETTDSRRDSLEFALINLAINTKMPILGICRGEQILNVYFGGSLYQDIPTDVPNNIGHRFSDIDSSYHKLNIVPNTLLSQISKQNTGNVNSSHHQAVNQLGKGLMVLARTNDSIVESITWKDAEGKGFLLGVQWHPEHLTMDNPLSINIGQIFLKEAQVFKNLKNKDND